MADEDKNINEVEDTAGVTSDTTDAISDTPSDEVIEETDATTELSDTTEGDDEPGEVEEAEGDGGEPTDTDGADGEAEEPTEELDTKNEKDFPVQEDIEKTDEIAENIPPIPPEDIEALRAEIEDLKYEKETNDEIAKFQELVVQQQQKYEELNTAVEDAVLKEFDKYGIPRDVDLDTLAITDPAKFQIFKNIMTNAKNFQDQETTKLQVPIQKAANDIVFRVAGKEMKKYKLTLEQAQEAAKTFVNIMNEVGVKDLKDDLIGKVELAVARGKLIVGDVKKTVEDTKDAVKETAEDIKDTADKISGVVDTVKEKVDTVKKEGKKLEDFTKSANPGLPPKGAEVNLDNVLSLYYSKPEKERLAFHAQYRDLILEALKNRRGV